MFNNELWQKPAGGGGDFYDYQIAKRASLAKGNCKYFTESGNGNETDVS